MQQVDVRTGKSTWTVNVKININHSKFKKNKTKQIFAKKVRNCQDKYGLIYFGLGKTTTTTTTTTTTSTTSTTTLQ